MLVIFDFVNSIKIKGYRIKVKINLDTLKDVRDFVNITSNLQGKITVTDGEDLVVNAKSLMGMLYSLEFSEL